MSTEEDRDLEAIAMSIVHQSGDLLYKALPQDIAHNYFVPVRQHTNDLLIDYVKKRVKPYATQRALEELKHLRRQVDKDFYPRVRQWLTDRITALKKELPNEH